MAYFFNRHFPPKAEQIDHSAGHIGMNPRIQPFLNTLSVLYVLFINYFSQAFGVNGNTVGSLSRKYDNLFTPASFAFAIWGIIFLLLIAYVVYEWISIRKRTETQRCISPWFLLANAMNGLWVIVWLYEWTAVSVLVMSVMLFALLKCLLYLKSGGWGESLFQNLPIAVYTGWISVAIIANSAAFLSKLGWTGAPLTEAGWAIAMIGIAVLVNLFVLVTTHRGAYVLVGVWALFAIEARQAVAHPEIAQLAGAGYWLLLAAWVIHTIWSLKTRGLKIKTVPVS